MRGTAAARKRGQWLCTMQCGHWGRASTQRTRVCTRKNANTHTTHTHHHHHHHTAALSTRHAPQGALAFRRRRWRGVVGERPARVAACGGLVLRGQQPLTLVVCTARSVRAWQCECVSACAWQCVRGACACESRRCERAGAVHYSQGGDHRHTEQRKSGDHWAVPAPTHRLDCCKRGRTGHSADLTHEAPARCYAVAADRRPPAGPRTVRAVRIQAAPGAGSHSKNGQRKHLRIARITACQSLTHSLAHLLTLRRMRHADEHGITGHRMNTKRHGRQYMIPQH